MVLGFIFALLAAVTWGAVYTIDQKVLSGVSPLALLFIDSIVAAVIMLPFVLEKSSSIKELLTSERNNLLLILLSIALALVANFFIFSSIKILGSADASIIEIAYPFFVVLFTFLFFRTSPNMYFFLGGALIFIGSLIIIKFA